MVSGKIAVKLEKPEWLDYRGKEIDEKDAVGRKSTHMFTHPEYGLLVDETGGNTSMTNDGNGSNKNILPLQA